MSERRDIVVIGASTGGLTALRQILADLPADFPAAVLVAMHVGNHKSILPEVLLPVSALPVRHAEGVEPVRPGTVLIAPPDHHLLVEPGRVLLSHGPKENLSRPAIDPLFRTAAMAYRDRAIGVILTGDLDDGTVGLQAIKAYGGIALVQDPEEAEAPSMPRSAMRYVDVDFCPTLYGIAETLTSLAGQPIEQQMLKPAPGWIPVENQLMSSENQNMDMLEKIAQPSALTCPECHGSLWEIEAAEPRRFRCHTGHGFTAASLVQFQERMAEEAIWAAVRALHEKEFLLKKIAASAGSGSHSDKVSEHAAAAERARQHAETLRKLVSG